MATLLGVLITQTFKSVGETRRRRHEANSRWHVENYRVRAAIVTKATAVERSLYSAASMLDDSEREPRMPGTKSIMLSPKEGIEGLFDRITRAILVEAVEDGFKVLDELDDLTGELAIIDIPEQAATRGCWQNNCSMPSTAGDVRPIIACLCETWPCATRGNPSQRLPRQPPGCSQMTRGSPSGRLTRSVVVSTLHCVRVRKSF